MNDALVFTSSEDAFHALFEAYNAHDIDAMLDLCSENAQLRHVPMGRFETGSIDTVGRKAWSDMFAALPDLSVNVESAVVGEFRAAAEVVIVDRARGFELPQAYFFAFNDTYQITNVTVYWDNVALGIEGTKAGAMRLVEAIASVGRR